MPRPERSFRTSAIIVKRRDFGEADRMLTVITPHHGKIEVLAKGARKTTSHKTGHVELFTQTEMLINTGRDFGIVAQAEMVEPYLPLREDLARGAYAAYAAELLDRFTNFGDEDSNSLFVLFKETLQRVALAADPRLAVRYFELRLLDLVGFRPEVHECIIGHEPIEARDQFFSPEQGGVVCPEHVVRSANCIPISMLALKLVRHMQRSPYKAIESLTISPPIHDEVERVLISYITSILERRLQSVEFIRQVRRSR
jgi:DNA repair protein RecO (recombination protein O)